MARWPAGQAAHFVYRLSHWCAPALSIAVSSTANYTWLMPSLALSALSSGRAKQGARANRWLQVAQDQNCVWLCNLPVRQLPRLPQQHKVHAPCRRCPYPCPHVPVACDQKCTICLVSERWRRCSPMGPFQVDQLQQMEIKFPKGCMCSSSSSWCLSLFRWLLAHLPVHPPSADIPLTTARISSNCSWVHQNCTE